MILVHYSAAPIGPIYDVEQDGWNRFRSKPRGLWVSVVGEHDWHSWCHSEGFALEHFEFATEIILRKDANILKIDNVERFDGFRRGYRAENGVRNAEIDWDSVASDHDGIIIAPCLWSRRLEMDSMWYYGWDCASGCIWRKRAIAEVRRYEARCDVANSASVS